MGTGGIYSPRGAYINFSPDLLWLGPSLTPLDLLWLPRKFCGWEVICQSSMNSSDLLWLGVNLWTYSDSLRLPVTSSDLLWLPWTCGSEVQATVGPRNIRFKPGEEEVRGSLATGGPRELGPQEVQGRQNDKDKMWWKLQQNHGRSPGDTLGLPGDLTCQVHTVGPTRTWFLPSLNSLQEITTRPYKKSLLLNSFKICQLVTEFYSGQDRQQQKEQHY